MKTFVELETRLGNLLAELDGDFWRKIMTEADPPRSIPDEQTVLDMVFRDAKAFSGYIPDLMAIMRRTAPSELDEANFKALRGFLGNIQLLTRILLMINIMPKYNDHEDLITTFNGYRQALTFVEDYYKAALAGV